MSRVDAAYHVPRASLADEAEHVRRLTLCPRDSGFGGNEPFEAYRLTDDTLSVPRFYGQQRWGDADEDGTAPGEPVRLAFRGTLTEVQERALTALQPTPETPAHKARGGTLVLPCGFGKTVAALKHICDTGVRALVLVTKSFLADQWEAQAYRFTDVAHVGRIQRDKVDVGDITIAMVQSLVVRDYDCLARFGLVVVDEAHHMCARAFSQALWKLPARRLLALSATPERADGLTDLLFWSLGDIAFRASRGAAEALRVRLKVYDGPHVRERKMRGQGEEKINLAAMLTDLCLGAARTDYVAESVRAARDEGHCVLVLSDRIAHLKALEKALVGLDGLGWYVGATKPDERRRVEVESAVILSTFSMAKEGLDIPRLSCLVLATPKGDIEQAVGRVQRPHPGKLEPVVLDVVDPYSIFAALRWKRQRFYRRNGYEIEEGEQATP